MNLQWHSLHNVLKSCREKAQCVLQMICSPGTKTQLSRATATEQSAKHVYILFIQNYSPAEAANFVLERYFKDMCVESSYQPSHLVMALGCPLGRAFPGHTNVLPWLYMKASRRKFRRRAFLCS